MYSRECCSVSRGSWIAGLLIFLGTFLVGVLASQLAIMVFPSPSDLELRKQVGPVHDPKERTPCQLSIYKYYEHMAKRQSIGITNESAVPVLLHVDANGELTDVLIDSEPIASYHPRQLVFPFSEKRLEPTWAYSMDYPLNNEQAPFTISIAYREAITGTARFATASFNSGNDGWPHSCYTTDLAK